MKSVIAVVVTYNRSEVLQKALDCIDRQDVPLSGIVVVDNGSSDDTLDVLERRAEQNPLIKTIKSPDNKGFGGGLHLGMTWVLENRNSDYIWLMDDDSFPDSGALALLLRTAEHTGYDLLGLSGYKMGWTSKKTVYPESHTPDVDFILIDNAIVSTVAARKAGVVSGVFFMMCEDLEYCLRLKKNGFRIGIIRNNHVRRLNLGSQKFSRTTLWRGYYHSRNHLLILMSFFSLKRLVHYLVLQSKYLLGSLGSGDRWWRIRLRIHGIIHGLAGKTGKTLDPATMKFRETRST